MGFLDRLNVELQKEFQTTASLLYAGTKMQEWQQTDSSDEEQPNRGTEHAKNGENRGKPFCLGPVLLPLVTLMKITNCLEPDDLSPAAQACKSLCIPININLQYILFLVRLLRLIVLGPEAARAIRECEESSGDDTDSTLPS